MLQENDLTQRPPLILAAVNCEESTENTKMILELVGIIQACENLKSLFGGTFG